MPDPRSLMPPTGSSPPAGPVSLQRRAGARPPASSLPYASRAYNGDVRHRTRTRLLLVFALLLPFLTPREVEWERRTGSDGEVIQVCRPEPIFSTSDFERWLTPSKERGPGVSHAAGDLDGGEIAYFLASAGTPPSLVVPAIPLAGSTLSEPVLVTGQATHAREPRGPPRRTAATASPLLRAPPLP